MDLSFSYFVIFNFFFFFFFFSPSNYWNYDHMTELLVTNLEYYCRP